jgi:hypothetical protein
MILVWCGMYVVVVCALSECLHAYMLSLFIDARFERHQEYQGKRKYLDIKEKTRDKLRKASHLSLLHV